MARFHPSERDEHGTPLSPREDRAAARLSPTNRSCTCANGGCMCRPRYHAAMELIKIRRTLAGQAEELEARERPVWFDETAQREPELELIDPAIEVDAQSEPQPAGAAPLDGDPSAEHTTRRVPHT